MGYTPWDHKELDTAERLPLSLSCIVSLFILLVLRLCIPLLLFQRRFGREPSCLSCPVGVSAASP